MSWFKNYYKINNIYSIPVIYGSMDFAQIVRTAFLDIKPDCLAIELPQSITKHMIEAVKRLPYLSVLRFGNHKYKYITIQPCDPAIEAIRLAQEYDVELYFIDKDIEENNYMQNYPESYYVSKVNIENFYNTYKKHIKTNINKNVYLKEIELAKQVKKMSRAYKKVLFLYGIEHFEVINYWLNKKTIPENNINETEYEEIELTNLEQNLYNKNLTTMPFVTYLYEITRKNLSRLHLGIEIPQKITHTKKDRNNEELFNENTFGKANWINKLPSTNNKLDMYEALQEIMIYTAKIYKKIYNDIKEPNISLSLKYARNYAYIENKLTPSPYQLITAAKNCINKNFANELNRVINFYPFKYNYDSLQTFNVSKNKKTIINKKSVKIIPYINTKPWLTNKIPLKNTPTEKIEGLWEKKWKKGGIFSYPPEDERIENFFQYLRNKGIGSLKSKKQKNIELNSYFLDEIDFKKTIQNLDTNKIFTKTQTDIKGSAGTVIIIFEENGEDDKYSHKMTKNAENINESDIVLYSSPPGETFVGPGMCKAQYGGLMSIFPAKGIQNVWYDKQFEHCKNKNDILLLSGIHYCDKKYIIYLAKQKPSKYFSSLARKKGKEIIYIPLTQIYTDTINQMRFFHFISDNKLTKIAHKYIK